jgi:hypothetical protein
MLAHVVATSTSGALATQGGGRPLDAMFRVVRQQLVEFNAQDIYSLCVTCVSGADTLAMMQDPEFMRGLKSSFERSEQAVLSPFQVGVVNDTFSKAGLHVTAKDVAIPEEDTISPESLLNVLQSMYATKTRDDRTMTKVVRMMVPLLDEFAPVQLVSAVKLLSMLKCSDIANMGKFGKRAAEIRDDLSPLDVATIATALAYTKDMPHHVLQGVFELVEQRCAEFKQDDFATVLQGLHAAGPRYVKTLTAMVNAGLEHIEEMDVNCLSYYLSCFVSMEYKDRVHIEIIVDGIIEKCNELTERQLVSTMQAVLALDLMSSNIFGSLAARCMQCAMAMDTRHIALVMDVCSAVPHETDVLMTRLMDRTAECFMLLGGNQLGAVLDILATYPPARDHVVLQVLGKQVKRRLNVLSPPALAQCVRGLSMLGYADPEFYIDATMTHLRWGFKDYTLLEPVLNGMCVSGNADPSVVKLLASHIGPMATQMTMHEVERANQYLNRLQCDEDRAFKALANRVRVFCKEVTPDMPQELQLLLQREYAPEPERRERRQYNN